MKYLSLLLIVCAFWRCRPSKHLGKATDITHAVYPYPNIRWNTGDVAPIKKDTL